MELLTVIHAPIEQELQQFATLFDEALSSETAVLNNILQHIKQRMGKRMRPILTLLIARSGGAVPVVAQYAALGIELLHTASLVHDDVVDEATLRRGQASVNAVYDNNISVLVGDFILATALHSIAQTRNSNIIDGLATLGRTLVSGELRQLSVGDALPQSAEERYFDIIRRKTAAMFAASAAFGAESLHLPAERVEQCRLFGENIGIAFQIRDDIFDYYDSSDIGKPTGNDMEEGKLTLPALYALSRCDDAAMHALADKVRQQEATADEIAQLIAFTKDNGGIEYAEQCARTYHAAATAFIRSTIRDKSIADALYAYVDYVVGRQR